MKITPKIDFIFKKIFGEKGSEEILKDLLEAILKKEITSIEIAKDVHLVKKNIENKEGILDVKAIIDKREEIDIEIQVKNEYNVIKRSLYYWSGLYYNGLNRGKKYIENKKVIVIMILDYNLLKEGPYHEIGRLRRDYENRILSEDIEIHYIQMPKCKEIETNLGKWISFIKYKDKKEVSKIVGENKRIKEADRKLKYLTGDEAVRRRAELKDRATKAYNTSIEYARQEGEERGKKIGKEIGEKMGIQKIAIKMKKDKMKIEKIIELTGLTKEEIEKL